MCTPFKSGFASARKRGPDFRASFFLEKRVDLGYIIYYNNIRYQKKL